ncbi:unnamed protein product [Zymoseptoria tritici ST99CH_3D1]|nr:unnamed protein product [Zymoseptoria tritici ST99CH_3D1]
MYPIILAVAASLYTTAQAHGSHAHEQAPIVAENADWATRHMAEEHHIANFDAGSFFTLHDFDSSNEWTHDDIYKFYGLDHHTTAQISSADKEEAVNKVIKLYDRDASGTVSFAEYTVGTAQGITLPDFGWGPGHHGDDEYEYEIHHWEKYHDENTKEEDLIHPEDIEHFRHHEEMDEQEERQRVMDQQAIVEANIPEKFRRKE